MARKSNQRKSPTDLDDNPDRIPNYEFDHRRKTIPGSQSWPDKFGPSSVSKALKAGLIVLAEIDGFPNPVAIKEAHWSNFGKVLEVSTLEGPRIPERLFTRKDVRGLRSTGEYVEP